MALDTGEALASATSTLAELSNYAVVVTDPTGTGYFPGQVLSSDLYSISGNQLTVTGAGSSFKANIIATIDVSTSTQKNKTLVNAAQNVATTSGTTRNDVFGNGAVILFSTIGQVHILANNIVKAPGATQQLFISDVARINSIFDFGSNEISTANLPTNATYWAKIINKGEGAYYSSGSRPNQSAQSWGIARLASSISSGKAAAVDYNILEKGCKPNSKALTLAKKAKRKYGYGTRRVMKVNV